MSNKYPLEGRYPVALGTAIGALIPFLVLTSAEPLFEKSVTDALGGSKTMLALASGLALAGYAFGALLAGDLAQRFRQRRLFLLLEALFTVGAVLAAVAWTPIVYLVGAVAEGLATGALLIAALPPVVRGYPSDKMPVTAGAIDMGFFGAITLGPLIGGVASAGAGWRIVHAAMAAAGVLLVFLGWLSLPDKPPPNEDLKFDWHAVVLAFVATVPPFAATGLLQSHDFSSPFVSVGLAVGLACFAALLVIEYSKNEPLSPVRPMWNTLPVVGVLVAMIGGGIYVAVSQLAAQLGLEVFHSSPVAVGFSFWPTVVAAVVASVLVGASVSSRLLPVLTGAGMLALIAGTWLFVALPSARSGRAIAAYTLLGFGAGATVSPGLWMAGLPLPSKMVGRTFALIELVRSEADFILAPVILKIAQSATGPRVTAGGARQALVVSLIVAISGTGAAALLYLLGVRTLETPNLARWLNGQGGALHSPPLLARLRGSASAARRA